MNKLTIRTFLTIFSLLYLSIQAQVTFDAAFESGNLNTVSTTDSVHYKVTTHEDIGGRWFYFRMSGVKDKFINVEILNSDVTKAMYSYDDLNYSRFSDDESPQINMFEKTYTEDTVYVAYYTPYNYSFLQQQLNEWKGNQFVRLDTLGFTPQNFPIQEMTVTDFSVPDSNKFAVWIHARTHPGETPSSWHFNGIMNELLSGKEIINFYLQKIIFHVVPFVNPDGVYYGRSRTNFDGIDLESNWDKPENETADEVKILRARMKELNDRKPFSVFLNLHSQASSYCTFWIHTASSTSDLFYKKEYFFANLNTSDNPYFEQEDFNESNLRSRYPEGWLWNNYGEQVLALTYETPYNSYFKDPDKPRVEVTNENLAEIGKRTLYSIAEFLGVKHPKRYLLDNTESFTNGNVISTNAGKKFYGSDYIKLPTDDTTAYVLFQTDSLIPNSSYSLYGWWQSGDVYAYDTKISVNTGVDEYRFNKNQRLNGGQWNYLGQVIVGSSGSISVKVHASQTGPAIADAFRLIYNNGVLSVKDENIPAGFILYQNYPNPFNPVTTIKYTITPEFRNTNVKLVVYDALGRKVKTLVNKHQAAGTYEATFNGALLSSGIYYYRLQVGSSSKTKGMILLK